MFSSSSNNVDIPMSITNDETGSEDTEMEIEEQEIEQKQELEPEL